MGDAYRVRDVCLQAHARAAQALGTAVPTVPSGMTLALQALECGAGGEAPYSKLFEQARRPFCEAAARDALIGVQLCMRFRTGPAGFLPPPAGVEGDRWGHDASPDILNAAVREAARYTNAAIYVTEHGINTDDDTQRLRHLQASLPGLQRCMADGIRVLGFTHWSLLDNFEWRRGYAQKFGLYGVDRQSFERHAKPSAAAYRELVRRLRAG